jgi:hypothetical protein
VKIYYFKISRETKEKPKRAVAEGNGPQAILCGFSLSHRTGCEFYQLA